jgi:L-cystine uptake protein TcyP (sodium:dicarboxylate symporter family)
MEDKANSEANIRFPDYVFTEMATEDEDSCGKKCNKTKVVTARKIENVRRCLSDNLLLLATVAGVLFGVVLGFVLRPLKLSSDAVMLVSYPGELFMRLLKLLVLPLIIASITAGSTRLNASMNGKIAIRTLVYFFLTSLTNAILGTFLVLSIHPGDPLNKGGLREESVDREVHILDGILDLGRLTRCTFPSML